MSGNLAERLQAAFAKAGVPAKAGPARKIGATAATGDAAPSKETALACLRNIKNVEGSRFDDRSKFVGLIAGVEVMCAPFRDDPEIDEAVWDVYLGYPGNDVEYVQHILDSNLDKDRGYRWVMEITGQGRELAHIDFEDAPPEWRPAQDESAPAQAESTPEKGKSKRPPILRFDALDGSGEAPDFVEDTLCDEQISVWYGEPNCGKTFLGIDLALRVSLGWRWHGRDVERGLVVYVAGEGAAGVKRRVAAFRKHYTPEKTAGALFAVVPHAVDFRDKASVAGLIEAVTAEAQRLDVPVRLIVVDTLSRALAGGDENSAVDMGAAVAGADRVRLATGAHVMLIHHSGKDAAKGARGHSLLKGNVDTEVMVERGEAPGTVVARVTKQRDLECAGSFSFRLSQVVLGKNRRGKPITSCVVEKAEMSRPKLPEKISTCLQILNELLPDDLSECGAGVACGVEIEAWREAVMKRLEEEGVANPVSRRGQFKRAKDALLSGGYITISGDQVDLAP